MNGTDIITNIAICIAFAFMLYIVYTIIKLCHDIKVTRDHTERIIAELEEIKSRLPKE